MEHIQGCSYFLYSTRLKKSPIFSDCFFMHGFQCTKIIFLAKIFSLMLEKMIGKEQFPEKELRKTPFGEHCYNEIRKIVS